MSLQFFDTLIIDLKTILNDPNIETAKRYHALESRVNQYINSMTFYDYAPIITGHYITLNGHYIKLFLEMGDDLYMTFDLQKEFLNDHRNPPKENRTGSQ